jgi:lantibiotic modifying enzyme
LLAGEAAEAAWEAIGEVAAALRSPAPAEEEDVDPSRLASLSNGVAGLALFYSYLAEASRDDGDADTAMDYLGQSLDALASLAMPPGLYAGFSGMAWTVEHLRGWLFESADEAGDSPVLDALLALLDREDWPGEYDLIGGLVGFGVYALEALPSAGARRCLERIVGHLERLGEERPEGVAWFTRPEWLPSHHREMAPAGYYNLGVAHGIPGVIGLLAGIDAAGISQNRTRPLLDRAVGWLLAQPWDVEFGRCYPHFLFPGVEPHLSRDAWCYGDPGIAAILLLAARERGREDWEREAVEAALRTARRPIETSSIRDVGLCHGSAGLAHLFNRLYHATGEEELAETARFWFHRTLEMRQPGEGIAGFTAVEPAGRGRVARRGLLTGTAGTALALLGAVSSIEPAWDRLLLAAVPPRTQSR